MLDPGCENKDRGSSLNKDRGSSLNMDKEPLILLVDDIPKYARMVKDIITETLKCKVIIASGGEEALLKIKNTIPDLILLDLMMPKLDGWEVCKRLRKNKRTCHIPIIMLTGKNTSEDEVLGLETGADDYIFKPFVPDVLIARIKTIFRRYQKETEREIKSGEIHINLDTHVSLIAGKPVRLWPKEFDLLYLLMKEKGRVFGRSILLECVWGYEYFGTTRTVDVTIERLRKKLGSQSKLIETVKGVGYKFVGEE